MTVRKIGIVGRTYRHIDRYRQILTVLVRYGFGELLEGLKIDQYLEVGLKLVSRRPDRVEEALTRAQRVRLAIEELGPTFVKAGQILSTRPDLLPVDFVAEFQRLQDRVPPVAWPEVESILREDLGEKLDRLFASIEQEPLASASLGQVHRARLRDGEEVVVKVQRPEIEPTIEIDLEILLHLAGLLERHVEGWEVYRPTRIVEEFAHTIQKELDYRIEADHIERFAWQFASDPTVFVPKVWRRLTTERVLTLEFVPGVKPVPVERLEETGLDRRRVAKRGAELLMKQVFVHGFFHADPHPGNILVLPGEVVCFLDFGMMGRIERNIREHFADLITAVMERRHDRAVDALLELVEADEEPDRVLLERELSDFVGRHLSRTLKEQDLGKIVFEALEALALRGLRIPPDLFLMVKAIVSVEGLGRELDPDFDIVRVAEPFLRRVRLARFHPKRLAADAIETGSEFLGLLRDLPGEARELIRQARRGSLKLEFEHHRLGPLIGALERVSNRLSFSVVLASLVIGSALIVLSGVPPLWNEIPVIGLVGFVLAGVLGFWLLVSILRHGRM